MRGAQINTIANATNPIITAINTTIGKTIMKIVTSEPISCKYLMSYHSYTN